MEFSARIYDPLGLASPFTTRVKLLFQQVWLAESEGGKKAKSWDEPLPDLIQEQWDEIKRDVPNLGDLSFPRCPFNGKGPPKEVEIFAFGDASKKAYGTAIYLVGVHEDGEKRRSFGALVVLNLVHCSLPPLVINLTSNAIT